jgi:hypothetical protein
MVSLKRFAPNIIQGAEVKNATAIWHLQIGAKGRQTGRSRTGRIRIWVILPPTPGKGGPRYKL